MYDKDNPLLDNPILMQVGAFSLVPSVNISLHFYKIFQLFQYERKNGIGSVLFPTNSVILMHRHGKDA